MSVIGYRLSRCQVAGILPTFYERVTLESHEQLVHLTQTFGRLVFPPIPQDTQCRVASRYGKTLWEHDPKAKALTGYEQGSKHIGGYRQALERLQELL